MSSPQRHLYKAFYILSLLVFAASLAFYILESVSFRNERSGKRPVEKRDSTPGETRPEFPLDINDAAPEELERIRGIGPVLAGRIVTFRERKGGFRTLEELQKVKGIGPVTYGEIQPYLTVKSGEKP